MRYYGYEEFVGDTKILIEKVKTFEPDTLLAIARGGLTLGHFMAEAMDARRLFALNSIHYNGDQKLDTCEVFNIPDLSDAVNVLIIDELIDSGETMVEILRCLKEKYPKVTFKVATLFYKPAALMQPDFSVKEATEWLEFFWEADWK